MDKNDETDQVEREERGKKKKKSKFEVSYRSRLFPKQAFFADHLTSPLYFR